MARILPSGYRQLEYIQSTGTQYIDTNYTFNTDTDTLNVTYEHIGGSVNHTWGFGCYYNQRGFGLTTGLATESNNFFYSSAKSISSSYFTGKHTCVADSNGISFDGTNILSFASFSFNLTLYLFSTNNEGAPSNYGSYKIYSYKQTRNGNLIRNFIPAIKLGDNAIGMYDTVEKKFYNNDGTGSFTAGPYAKEEWESYEKKINVPILPSGYTELEYIQSTGTQYINTEYEISSTNFSKLKYMVDCAYTSQSNWMANGVGGNSTCDVHVGLNGNRLFSFGNGHDDVVTSISASFNTRYILTLDIPNTEFSVVNSAGTSIVTTTVSPQAVTTSADLFLSAWNGGTGTAGNIFPEILYGCKIYENEDLVRNMIPAKNSSNVLGMYDLCGSICSTTNTPFYPNVGSGSFTAGPEISYRTYNCYKSIITVSTPRLPSEYTELDYIQSSSNQYIDTGIIPEYGQKFECKFFCNLGNKILFGGRSESSGGNGITWGFIGGSAGARNVFNMYGSSNGANSITVDVIDSNAHTLVYSDSIYTIDGITQTDRQTIGAITTTSSIFLGTWNNAGTPDNRMWSGKIYYFKVWDNNEDLVRNLIPAKRISDSVLGMYDLVSGTFFTNAGTDSFTAGSVVNPKTTFEIYKREITA